MYSRLKLGLKRNFMNLIIECNVWCVLSTWNSCLIQIKINLIEFSTNFICCLKIENFIRFIFMVLFRKLHKQKGGCILLCYVVLYKQLPRTNDNGNRKKTCLKHAILMFLRRILVVSEMEQIETMKASPRTHYIFLRVRRGGKPVENSYVENWNHTCGVLIMIYDFYQNNFIEITSNIHLQKTWWENKFPTQNWKIGYHSAAFHFT